MIYIYILHIIHKAASKQLGATPKTKARQLCLSNLDMGR